LSESLIEGPAGTDFTVKLNSGRFDMDASFITDLIAEGELRVRATLKTRRLYGRSERDLPLYEEDQQRETFSLTFDEQIVLLPFGRGEDEQLRMQIVPALSRQSELLPTGGKRPLEIKLLKQSAGGQINIFASKIPHRFDVEASLLEDGRPIARGRCTTLLKDACELALEAVDPRNFGRPINLALTVDEYSRSRPNDQATIRFDLDRLDASGKPAAIARNWSGVCELGKPLTYSLGESYRGEAGREYQLSLTVRLAKGESTE
jgi:hypothetical protein